MDILTTPRLALRWFTEDDAPFVLRLINDPDWHRHINDSGVRDEAAAREWIAQRLTAPYWTRGHGFWAVIDRASGSPVGLAGIFKRDSLPHPDVGYGFLSEWRGKGLAQEAAAACVAYARDTLGITRLMGITSPANTASQRVLAASGLHLQGTELLPGEARPAQIWAMEWPAPADDDAAIDALLARFFAAFDNRGPQPHRAAALPSCFTPEAIVITESADGTLTTSDVRGFIAPRAELLAPGGPLTAFHEWAEEVTGWQEGSLAQRRVRYAKAGVLNGIPFKGGGVIAMQLLKQDGRWRIAALAWQDEGDPGAGRPLPASD